MRFALNKNQTRNLVEVLPEQKVENSDISAHNFMWKNGEQWTSDRVVQAEYVPAYIARVYFVNSDV